MNGKKVFSKLSFIEEEALEKVKGQLINEWSVTIDDPHEILAEKLEKAFETSIEKSEN